MPIAANFIKIGLRLVWGGCLALGLLGALPMHAQGGAFRVATEAEVPLSLAQEAEEAIDRAHRWLLAQPAETNSLAHVSLRRYALATKGEPFALAPEAYAALETLLPPPMDPSIATNLTAALETFVHRPRELFALQRDLPAVAPTPDWRERLVLHFVNHQQVEIHGGTWGTATDTAWAILALRALLNESIPITPLASPEPGAAHD